MKYSIFFLLIILFCQPLVSLGQEGYPDCVHPEIVVLPLTNDNIQEQIYYQEDDKYTYWYKLSVKASCKVSYKLSSISRDDEYDILIYNFKGANFCNELVKKKVKPVTNKTEGILQLEQGEIYYLGVIHINGFGCGHTFTISENDKIIAYKAIQNDCVEEVMEELVVIKSEPIEEIEKPLKSVVTIDPIKSAMGLVVNSVTKKSIEAVITLIGAEGTPSIQLISSVDSGFVLNDYSIDKMVVSITKFGYETLLDTIDLTTKNLKIKLNPIKVGDKLIMRKIYFHPNTYVLREESKDELKKLNRFMLENSEYSFEIQGHTNGNRNVKKIKRYANLGEEWNFKGTSKKLSKKRAEKIKTYLVKNGVKSEQLKTIGYGGDRMIVEKPKNMKQAMKNIRVEVIVLQD